MFGKVFNCGVASKKVKTEYDSMIKKIGNEFYILLDATEEEISKNVLNVVDIQLFLLWSDFLNNHQWYID